MRDKIKADSGRQGLPGLGVSREHLSGIGLDWVRSHGAYLLLDLLGRSGEEIGDPYFEGNWETAFADIQRCVDSLAALKKSA